MKNSLIYTDWFRKFLKVSKELLYIIHLHSLRVTSVQSNWNRETDSRLSNLPNTKNIIVGDPHQFDGGVVE